MSFSSRLGKQITEIVSALNDAGVRFALIGGLALASHKVVRATQDVDLLVDVKDRDTIDSVVTAMGYSRRYRSDDVANYKRDDEHLDFLYAKRPAALQLLASAVQYDTVFGPLSVVSAEGIIGFKLQALVNDPRRTQDREDIKALLRANRATLNFGEVKEYFRLFGKESLLDDLLKEIG